MSPYGVKRAPRLIKSSERHFESSQTQFEPDQSNNDLVPSPLRTLVVSEDCAAVSKPFMGAEQSPCHLNVLDHGSSVEVALKAEDVF